MAEIDVLQTGKMLVSSAVHNRDSKSGKFAYTGLFQSKKGRNDVPVKAFLIRINGKNVLVDTGWSEQCAINPRHHLGLALYFSTPCQSALRYLGFGRSDISSSSFVA